MAHAGDDSSRDKLSARGELPLACRGSQGSDTARAGEVLCLEKT